MCSAVKFRAFTSSMDKTVYIALRIVANIWTAAINADPAHTFVVHSLRSLRNIYKSASLIIKCQCSKLPA